MTMRNEDREQINRLKALLDAHGITLKVGGCGCCGSPWVTVTHNGAVVSDTEDAPFDTSRDDLGEEG